MTGRRIFVASVPHTGTWFTLNMLKASPDVAGIILERHWHEDPRCPKDEGTWVLHAHVGYEPTPSRLHGDLQWFGPDVPLIIPMRDPITSLVTRATRHPELEHHDLVAGFRRVAKVPAFFFPVDLRGDRAARAKALFDHAGIRPCDHGRIAAWQPDNSVGPTRRAIHHLHATGDWKGLTAALGTALDELVSLEAELRPWLESLGYRNLLWWGR